MPIPFLVWAGVAGVTALVGVGAGAKAVRDKSKAKDINENAQDIIDAAKRSLENARSKGQKALEALGETKLNTCQTSIKKFVDTFEKIKNVELQDSAGLQELSKFHVEKLNVKDFKATVNFAGTFAAGIASGTIAGGAVAFGAYSAAGALATASTGTAIAGLSGAAATNATLAFFGGGSLAAGGLGIAGGTVVLGGLVTGPGLAILGIVMAASASKELDNARSNLAIAKEARKGVDVLVTACKGIIERADLFQRVIVKLNLAFMPLLKALDNVVESEGTDYAKYSPLAKQTVAASLSMAQSIKAIIDTPLLDKDGKLTEGSCQIAEFMCKKWQIHA